MAEMKPSCAPRPNQGVRRSATPSGVTHVRTSVSGQYVVVGNHLAQHRDLSLTAIGLATHIFSVPEGTPVDIRSIAERFPEGRERIAMALRELEAHGYLERIREHTEEGRLVTRTYAHHTPESVRAVVTPFKQPVRAVTAGRDVRRAPVVAGEGDGQQRDAPQEDDPAPAKCAAPVVQTPVAAGPAASESASEVPAPVAPLREQGRREARLQEAVGILAGLRHGDARLTLSVRDVHRLAPSVIGWLERGATPAVVHRTLTAELPVVMKYPAGVIAYRLRELVPPPLPALPTPSPRADGPYPFQDCDGCERVFRAAAPGRCRECRSGPVTASGDVARAA